MPPFFMGTAIEIPSGTSCKHIAIASESPNVTEAPKPEPIGKSYICSGCGYEYNPEIGDEENDVMPGTLFEKLPEDWVCPECAESKDQFIEE